MPAAAAADAADADAAAADAAAADAPPVLKQNQNTLKSFQGIRPIAFQAEHGLQQSADSTSSPEPAVRSVTSDAKCVTERNDA